ncbi:MAG: hypothetical protein ACRELB_22295, partial [Polyangiaceae bacterium]
AGVGGTDGASGDAPGSFVGDGSQSFPDVGSGGQDGGTGPALAVVYAHSADTLYRMDATSKQVAVVGPFSGGCSSVIDIAIDSSSSAYVTTSSGLWKLDLQSAACTHISSGSYPNSLSFVPKGTLDPNAEAMVGYSGSEYIHINTTTGAVTSVGQLSGGYSSSGDIVSVIGGGTFLTVKGPGCSDCLLQIDPKTGDLVQSYGSIAHTDVFGLAFWAGTAYGFDNAGVVFSIAWQNNKLVTADIPVPNPPPGLSFWGAGSTTSAPPTAADGGGIPIQ